MSLQEYRDKGRISGITFTILMELIKRKKEKDKWKRREAVLGLCLTLFASIGIISIFFIYPGTLNSMHHLHTMISRPSSWAFLILCGTFLFFFTYCHGEREDAEDDYDELREEVIDREKELWLKDQPDQFGDTVRYGILRYLKKEFDINLFYK
ncbi:YpbF family protein [Sporolactobacillus shoreicorticis]|uniref:DUF2663 family protein n=1 Tax=Sporolactobacillus shoreicorticis TaxID=1923877 RepID=A0ABW5S0Z5_9BACL|nr:DUF2663 family protein [Sporolactobacillus shoreicorticis]MCO7126743.1 YpbF family protein [Sporolactobacillus shoreicorticis]